MGKKKEAAACCEKYRKKAKFCSDCPLSKKKRKKLLEKAKR